MGKTSKERKSKKQKKANDSQGKYILYTKTRNKNTQSN